MTDRFNQPAQGAEDWGVPLNENFADLGVEVADEVASWADLPAPSGEQSSSGNPKVYRVAADDVFVADAGTSWSIIGGLGSADNPLPPSHHESIHTEKASITDLFDPIEQESTYYKWTATTADTLNTSSQNGAGVFMSGGVRLKLDIAAQTASACSADDEVFEAWNYPSWDKPRKCRISFYMSDPAEQVLVGTGKVLFNDDTRPHIGCRIEDGNIFIHCSDGTNTNMNQVRTGVTGANQYEFFTDYDGDSNAKVTVRQLPQSNSSTPNWTETLTLTSNLPSGYSGSDNRKGWSASAGTDSSSAFEVHLNSARYFLENSPTV